MESGHSKMQYEYLSPHGIEMFEDAVSHLNGGNRRAPVPTSLVWRELQNELICHKCFDEYISLLEIYYDAPNGADEEDEEGPQQQGDGEEGADNAVDEGGGRDAVRMYCVSTNALSPKIVNPRAMMSWPGSASFIPNSDVTQAVKSDAHPGCVMSAHLNLHLASEPASSNIPNLSFR
jgi:hypothetical protein